eukprot:5787181-Amphidinium_carterae.1
MAHQRRTAKDMHFNGCTVPRTLHFFSLHNEFETDPEELLVKTQNSHIARNNYWRSQRVLKWKTVLD